MFKRKKNQSGIVFIEKIKLPLLELSIKDAKKQSYLSIKEDDTSIKVLLSFVLTASDIEALQQQLTSILKNHDCTKTISVRTAILSRVVQGSLKPLPGIKNIIAITAGKGGVGKSTIALNTAVSLKKLGAKVGLLDADIYGPNQPQLLGIDSDRTELKTQDNYFLPVESHGIPTMSIAYLIDSNAPAIWRGPMVTKALMQMLMQTQWGELDYLIIDMPPGTGDIPLTLAQKIPVTGSVVVATPQALALSDIEKSMAMLRKVGIAVLGIVENMGLYHCTECGAAQPLFSQSHASNLSQRFDTDVLTSIPLDRSIDAAAHAGTPIALADNNPAALAFEKLASKISIAIAGLKRDYSVQFPKVVVENNTDDC
jgi:ATP-binding protein involved in chromosome partitioning